MDYILYYKIREQLIKDYNYLKGGNPKDNIELNVEKYESILPKLIEIEKMLNTLQKSTKIDDLQKYIDLYKIKLQEVISKVDPYLTKVIKIKDKFGSNDLQEFFNGNNKFTEFINKYNEEISKKSWTKERLNKEIYSQNEKNPELMEELFIENENTFENFNKQLLLLFKPFLDSYEINKDNPNKEILNKNLDENITYLNDLIVLVQEYKEYINIKKKGVETIINIVYDKSDVITYDNTDNKIKNKEDYLEELKEENIPDESKLNLASIFDIRSKLNSIIIGLEINDEMKLIEDFDILDMDIDLKKILSLKDVVSIKDNTNMSGGEFETKYIVKRKTNEKLFKLLQLTDKLYLTIDTILNDSKYLQQIQIRYNYYLAYIFLIIRQSASKDILIVFKYLSIEIIQKYLDILEKIKNKFTSLTDSDVNTKYLNKYHYITIDKLTNLFRFLKGQIPSKNILIDVSKCTGNVLNDLNLFNHFKSIIKDYINTSEGKNITGINDINEIII